MAALSSSQVGLRGEWQEEREAGTRCQGPAFLPQLVTSGLAHGAALARPSNRCPLHIRTLAAAQRNKILFPLGTAGQMSPHWVKGAEGPARVSFSSVCNADLRSRVFYLPFSCDPLKCTARVPALLWAHTSAPGHATSFPRPWRV